MTAGVAKFVVSFSFYSFGMHRKNFTAVDITAH